MTDTNKLPLEDFHKISETFKKVMDEIEAKSEAKWNALDDVDQLDYFCAIVRRICKAELVDQTSYRGALYGVFGFGPEAYVQAQMAGYLELHNSIYTSEHEKDLLTAFAKRLNPEMNTEEINAQVTKFRFGELL